MIDFIGQKCDEKVSLEDIRYYGRRLTHTEKLLLEITNEYYPFASFLNILHEVEDLRWDEVDRSSCFAWQDFLLEEVATEWPNLPLSVRLAFYLGAKERVDHENATSGVDE